MRYFSTSNATRSHKLGAYVFTFEPIELVGGTWHGVLAVDDVAASTLTASQSPLIKEITEVVYEAQKKKNGASQQLANLAARPAQATQQGGCGSCGQPRHFIQAR